MKPPITLDDAQREVLEHWSRPRIVRVRWRERALTLPLDYVSHNRGYELACTF